MIYFALASGTDLVKIGFTSGDPLKRLGELQTGCPHKLVLLGTSWGDEQKEASLHAEFKDVRVSGEWFRLTTKTLIRIAQLANPDTWELARAVVVLQKTVKRLEEQLAALTQPAACPT